jgi:hypothetical protein
MGYPLIFATNGDMFARLNHDVSWSVRWDRVLSIVYSTPGPRQKAVWAFAKLMLAARDNFVATPWEESERLSAGWVHYEAIIDYLDEDPPPSMLLSHITFNGRMIGKINSDGTWSVLWDDVLEVARRTDQDFRASALIGVCRLLRAAKDRFLVTPWVVAQDDE